MQSQILRTKFTDEYSDNKVSINKIFDLKHKENIKKAMETLLSLYRSWNCGRQNNPLTDSAKNHPEKGRSGLTNSGNLV